MPKMKTNSAASKRARITGSGKVMQAGSAMRHNLEHKSARKRRAPVSYTHLTLPTN